MATLSVGFGRTDITPKESVPLCGYGNTSRRMSGPILDPLYATCLAFSDDEGSVVLAFALDLTSPRTAFRDRLLASIGEATGVAPERILCSCSHNHSAPDLGNDEQPSIPRYIDFLETQLIAAAKAAMADRAPASLQIGSIETQGLNFVRHYLMADGTYAGDNHGSFKKSTIVRHETEADHILQMMKILRPGKQEIQVANFQMHPHRAGGATKPEVTSDIVGAFRSEVERQQGCLFVYFSGASGNVNGHSRIPEENITPDYIAHGKALADYAARVQYRDVRAGAVRFACKVLDEKVDHSRDGDVPKAREAVAAWKSGMPREQYKPIIRALGFHSPYHANAVIAKSEMGESWEVPLWAFSIGDVAFVAGPYEMFDTNGMQIKEASPFAMTFVLTCTNEFRAYFPSALGFEHGGYSVDICRFTPGVGERAVEEFLAMLRGLKE
ncbi:MAG: hypothetical protein IJT18_01670 [Oscillospiraceae bacterium]|nr:hypothetical protein [Oscillospiraceae bacterium]